MVCADMVFAFRFVVVLFCVLLLCLFVWCCCYVVFRIGDVCVVVSFMLCLVSFLSMPCLCLCLYLCRCFCDGLLCVWCVLLCCLLSGVV